MLFGVGLPDENAHAPNEKLDLGNFHGGIIASAFLYDEIAKAEELKGFYWGSAGFCGVLPGYCWVFCRVLPATNESANG